MVVSCLRFPQGCTQSTIIIITLKEVPWKWGLDQQQAFQASRDIFTSDKFLAHFDHSVPLTLACNQGMVSVPCWHKMADGSEKLI